MMKRTTAIFSLLCLIPLLILTSAASAQGSYVTQPGDTLWSIARAMGVTVDELIAANNITNPELIHSGMTLVRPGQTPVSSPEGAAPSAEYGTYTVVRGDTLGTIAARFNTNYFLIAEINGIANPDQIFVGQVLRVPNAPPPVADTGGGNIPIANLPPPAAGGGFELGGQAFGFGHTGTMRSAGMTWIKFQLRYGGGTDASGQAGQIQQAHNAGLRILYSVIGDHHQLRNNPAQFYRDYAAFLGSLASHGVDGIEVWNEQNIEREWPNGFISGSNYTDMLRAAYAAIKAANPNTLVISGAPSPTGYYQGGCQAGGCNDDVFIRQMAAAGAANYMDCLGIHYNSGSVPPTARSGAPVGSSGHYTWYYPTMVELYRSVFPTKQLCFTEFGYVSPEGYGPISSGFAWGANTSVAEQADWLATAVRLGRASGYVRLFIVWNIDAQRYDSDPQAGYAIIRPGGGCPACGALAAAMQ
ncbi:MAG: LysM peptidoglycan-binding domain-containing protein [Anaerolineaceae bacterium]|nr:LysM peptidoglycan-binding domain-containing protein [Anaerolineaceae bacterium]